MTFNENIDFNNLIGHSTLLFGESNTKKTYYTAKFVQFLLVSKKYSPDKITILDFAPKLYKFYDIKIGGRIEDFYPNSIKCKYLQFPGEIIPPRLNASNKSELYQNACRNFKKIRLILENYNENPTSVLIINDISIYLHLGSKYYLLDTIKKADTFFGNSYYGTSINKKFTKLFSKKEALRVEFLIKNMDFTNKTN